MMSTQGKEHGHLIGQLLTNRHTVRCWDDDNWVDLPPNQLFILLENHGERDDGQGRGRSITTIQWGERLLYANISFNEIQPALEAQGPAALGPAPPTGARW